MLYYAIWSVATSVLCGNVAYFIYVFQDVMNPIQEIIHDSKQEKNRLETAIYHNHSQNVTLLSRNNLFLSV